MTGRPTQRKAPWLFALFTAVFAATTLVWLYLDRTPPNWDDAWYLTKSLAIYDALTRDGLVGYIAKVESAFTFRAPLIAMLPTPFYLALGRHWHAAYLVNVASMLLLFAAVYDLACRWWSSRAGFFAVLIVGTMPLLYGLATWFMVEYALTAIVAAAVWLLIESDGLARRGVVVLFGIVCGLGLLLKASFSMFILFLFLYFWTKARNRIRVLLYALIPCLTVALPWYAFHLRETVEFGFAAGYGKTAGVYGTGAIFSFHSIASYLSNVVKEGISGYYAGMTVVVGGWTFWRSRKTRSGDEARPRARAILLWLLPFAIYLFGKNKDVRLIAPILPAFALLLASMLDSALPRRGAGTALAGAALAFPLLQLYSVSFGVPVGTAEMGYARRFHRDSWLHDEILKTIAANVHIGPGDKPLVLVGTDVATLNPDNVELTAVANQLPLRIETTAHEEDLITVQNRLEGASFFVCKEGGQRESPFNLFFDRLARRVREDKQFSEISRGWAWPDGGVVRVFKNLAVHSRPAGRAYLNSGLQLSAEVEIAFGETLALNGLSASKTADALDVKYRWYCIKRPAREYKCFTHVLDSDGKFIGQLDHYLLDGDPPVRTWEPGDDALEEMRTRIPVELSGKTIRLRIGLFDPRSGERLRIEIPHGTVALGFSLVDGGTALLSAPVQ